MLARIVSAALVFIGWAATSAAVTFTVSSTSDPWLAGMPAAATASLVDVGSGQAPMQAAGMALRRGNALRFSATGMTDHCNNGGWCGLAGPDGDSIEGSIRHVTGAENGIADLFAPIDSLIGVFLDAAQPDLGAAPDALDFSTLAARDFASLSPLLKQPFFIGDGFRNDGVTRQSFIVPDGATRLYLGTMDGYEWENNTGTLSVTVMQALEARALRAQAQAPEPGTLALALAPLVWIRFFRQRHSSAEH